MFYFKESDLKLGGSYQTISEAFDEEISRSWTMPRWSSFPSTVWLWASIRRQGGYPLKIAALGDPKISKTRKEIKGRRMDGRRGKMRIRFRKWKIGGRLEFGEEEGYRKLKELILIATPTRPHVRPITRDPLTGDLANQAREILRRNIHSSNLDFIKFIGYLLQEMLEGFYRQTPN